MKIFTASVDCKLLTVIDNELRNSEIITSLESSAAWYGSVEEWFVAEQGAFIVIVLVVEVFASGDVQTFRRALAPV